jgi:hypothetical protein
MSSKTDRYIVDENERGRNATADRIIMGYIFSGVIL